MCILKNIIMVGIAKILDKNINAITLLMQNRNENFIFCASKRSYGTQYKRN